MSRPGALFRMLPILAAGCFIFGPATAQSPGTTVSGGSDLEHLEKETFLLVNKYRASNGLPLLTWNEEIAKLARAHSRDMASGEVDFGHGGFRDRMKYLQLAYAGLRGGGENVLMTDDPEDIARKAVEIWLHSPEHLANIRGDFNCSGIGISENAQGMVYFTQIFARIVQTPSY